LHKIWNPSKKSRWNIVYSIPLFCCSFFFLNKKTEIIDVLGVNFFLKQYRSMWTIGLSQRVEDKKYRHIVRKIRYLVFVGKYKKNVTCQTWRALFNFGEYLFQSTRHFGECLKKLWWIKVFRGCNSGKKYSTSEKKSIFNVLAKISSILYCIIKYATAIVY
jgi:hypothetical protein